MATTHKSYTSGNCEVFVNTHASRTASVAVWSNLLGTYVRQDGRHIAALALLAMRQRGVHIRRTVDPNVT